MEGNNELAKIEKINAGINDANNVVYISKQCLKSQDRISKNLLKRNLAIKRENQSHREENSKSKDYVEKAAQTFDNLISVVYSIKDANTELTSETLSIQEQGMEIVKRMQKIEDEYEKLWLETTEEWNGLGGYRKFSEVQNRNKDTDGEIGSLKETINSLKVSIVSKKRLLEQGDRDRIINFARFMVHEMPKYLNLIRTTQENDRKLNIEIEKLMSANDDSLKGSHSTAIKYVCEKREKTMKAYKWLNTMSKIELNDEAFKLPLGTLEIDENPDIKKVNQEPSMPDIFQVNPSRDNNMSPESEWDDFYASRYLTNATISTAPSIVPISTEKQINLINSKNIDGKEAHSMITSINHKKLKSVEMIGLNCFEKQLSSNETMEASQQNMNIPISSETMQITELIEVEESLHTPPTQFRDLPEKKTPHAEKSIAANTNLKMSDNRKRVAFEVPEKSKAQNDIVMEQGTPSNVEDTATGDNTYCCDEVGAAGSKDRRDSSPDFVYARNDLKKNVGEQVLTSKFFVNPENVGNPETNTDGPMEDNAAANNQQLDKLQSTEPVDTVERHKSPVPPGRAYFVSDDAIVSPRSDTSLDSPMTSMDTEFQSFIASNLLLSPKGDMPEQNTEPNTGEMPNILSGGTRRTFSIFHGTGDEGSNTDQSARNEENFNFNFGSKNPKGGFFDIFKYR